MEVHLTGHWVALEETLQGWFLLDFYRWTENIKLAWTNNNLRRLKVRATGPCVWL